MSLQVRLAGTSEEIMAASKEWRLANRSRPGLIAWIYAIQAGGKGGPIKIGFAESPGDRLTTLQQGSHEELRGIAAWRDFKTNEKVIHRLFAEAHVRGEWFRPVPELVELVLWMGGDFCDWPHSDLLDPTQFPMWDGCEAEHWKVA